MYQMEVKWPKGHKIFQHFSFQDYKKINPDCDFGLKIKKNTSGNPCV
jgi:hypothetical protein